MEASRELRAQLVHGERVGGKMIRKLEAGVPIPECVDAVGERASDLRQSAAEALVNYENRRHEMRRMFIEASVASGRSLGEIARDLGVSRQLVQRLSKEE